MEKKKADVVRPGEKRPVDLTPKQVITFLGYVEGNPHAEGYVDFVGAVTGEIDHRKKERWIDIRRIFTAQDCLVEVNIHQFSNREDVLELLKKIILEVEAEWPLMPPEGIPQQKNVTPIPDKPKGKKPTMKKA
jgi:hypothetical protein